jgi:hypothetical protein
MMDNKTVPSLADKVTKARDYGRWLEPQVCFLQKVGALTRPSQGCG